MKLEIKVPQAGESVTEAMISDWYKEDGEIVAQDEALLELETDKANMELNAEKGGRLTITVAAKEMVTVGQVIGYIDTEAAGESAEEPAPPETASTTAPPQAQEKILSPAAKRVAAEAGVNPNTIAGTGKDGRVLKEDAVKAAADAKPQPPAPKAPARQAGVPVPPMPAPPTLAKTAPAPGSRGERVVNMSMMRRRIASRLVEAQQTAAILTTFNEVDLTEVMAIRNKFKDAFLKKYGVKLGMMSFFIKAAIEALKAIPEINAYIVEDNKIQYNDYIDIGVAVGTEKGLVVPVIRDVDQMNFADIEKAIMDYAIKARDGKISLDDLKGGTFTISNGGVYGSLLSTPILNPPQSGILGMHNIQKRAMVMPDGSIQARPMMYLALSYDHRMVDGKGAVTFLVKIKECLEDPARLLLEI